MMVFHLGVKVNTGLRVSFILLASTFHLLVNVDSSLRVIKTIKSQPNSYTCFDTIDLQKKLKMVPRMLMSVQLIIYLFHYKCLKNCFGILLYIIIYRLCQSRLMYLSETFPVN